MNRPSRISAICAALLIVVSFGWVAPAPVWAEPLGQTAPCQCPPTTLPTTIVASTPAFPILGVPRIVVAIATDNLSAIPRIVCVQFEGTANCIDLPVILPPRSPASP